MDRPAFYTISTKLSLVELIAHLNTRVFPQLFAAAAALVSNFSAQTTGKTVNAAYLATLADGLIRVDATAGPVVVTLPPSGLAGRKRLTIKKVDGGGNAVTIDANAAELIDGALTKVLGAFGVATIQANDVGWDVL